MDYESGALEKPEDLEKDPKGVVRRWILELKLADKRESEWRKKSERIWNRYRQKEARRHSFNILWSNTETLRPAVYNSPPTPDVRRRFKDEDPIGKAVAEVICRCLEYSVDTTDFNQQIESTVLDMLLPGRGVCRVRYVPSLRKVEGVEVEESSDEEALQGDYEELEWEQCNIEHVQWDDFRIGSGKEWSEVTWIAFRHRLTRDELEEQFPDCGSEIKLDNTDDDDVKAQDEADQEAFKTAEVWEIWDKEEGKVLFIAPSYKEKPVKTLDDPLKLNGFWPIPQPIYAIEDSSCLVPVPLYEMYKEQADELDTITKRLNILTKGLKMRGIYDATISELSELMRGEDNDLIPAQNVTALLERGGLEKAIWFMPIEQAAKVMQILQLQREACKQTIYELTGISDILRGATNPNETLGAQQIKANWGGLRVNNLKGEVVRFIRDLIRLQAEIIAERFQPETIVTMTNMKLPSMQDKQTAMMQYQQQAQMAQQQGQQPPPTPDIGPTWEEVIQVMRDDKQRTFKIDVETDSTVAASMESDMVGLREVLTAVTQIMQAMAPAVQTGAMPIEAVKEMILAVTRRAKMGNAVEDALDKMKAPNPPPQEQDNSLQVEEVKQKAETEREQARMQMEAQLEQMRMSMEQQAEDRRIEREMMLEQMRMQGEAMMERFKTMLDAETKVNVAQISANATLSASQDAAAEQATRQ